MCGFIALYAFTQFGTTGYNSELDPILDNNSLN
jgi:hypothetical protein